MDCKIYVGDLPRDASEKEIERAFCYYGLLRSVWVARNPAGFAVVEYEDPRDAEDLDGTNVCGSRVRVDHSTGKIRPKPWMRGSRGPGDLSTLKTDVLNVVTGAIMPTIVLVLSVEGGQGLQGIEPADPDPILDPEGAFLEAGAEVEAVVGLPEELTEATAETKIPVPFNEATRKDEDLPRRINVLRVYQI